MLDVTLAAAAGLRPSDDTALGGSQDVQRGFFENLITIPIDRSHYCINLGMKKYLTRSFVVSGHQRMALFPIQANCEDSSLMNNGCGMIGGFHPISLS